MTPKHAGHPVICAYDILIIIIIYYVYYLKIMDAGCALRVRRKGQQDLEEQLFIKNDKLNSNYRLITSNLAD